MSVSATIGLGILAAGVAFGGHHYWRAHLPDFAMVKAEVLYEKCMRECHEVCEANRVPADVCQCGHCRKYLEGG